MSEPQSRYSTRHYQYSTSPIILGWMTQLRRLSSSALKPRENNLGEESQRKDDEKPPSHLVNSALLELHLCGNAFDSGVVKIQEVLDPLRNGSSGATASTVNVVFARNTTDSSFSRSVLDAAGDDHELVFPVTIGCAAERRQLSYWHWRPWNTPELSANRVDPRAEAKATASVEEESLSGSKSSLKIITLLGRRCPGVWVILFEVYFFTAWRVATPSYRRIGESRQVLDYHNG